MKTLLASLLVVTLPAMLAGNEAGTASPAVQESLVRIRQAFPYEPAAPPGKPAAREPEDPAVMMERLTVVGSFQYRQLQQKLENETRQKQAGKFNLARGGLLLRKDIGGIRLELGSWENPGSGLTFLRLLW